jgi:hypothetical protein
MKPMMIGAVTFLVGQLMFGCGDNEVDRTFDCGEICAKYNHCVNEIDVTECIDHCEDEADAHSNVEQAADACEDCLDGRTCDEVASCIPDCELVPIRK